MTRYVLSSEPIGVLEAHSTKYFPNASDNSDEGKVDINTSVTLLFPNAIKAHMHAGFYRNRFGLPGKLIGAALAGFGRGITLRCEMENGVVELKNFVVPHIWHSLIVTPKDGKKRVEKVYAFKGTPKVQEKWST